MCVCACVCVLRHVIDGHKMILLREDDKEQKVRHFPLHSSLILVLLLLILLTVSLSFLFFLFSFTHTLTHPLTLIHCLTCISFPSPLYFCSFLHLNTKSSIFFTHFKFLGRSMYI